MCASSQQLVCSKAYSQVVGIWTAKKLLDDDIICKFGWICRCKVITLRSSFPQNWKSMAMQQFTRKKQLRLNPLSWIEHSWSCWKTLHLSELFLMEMPTTLTQENLRISVSKVEHEVRATRALFHQQKRGSVHPAALWLQTTKSSVIAYLWAVDMWLCMRQGCI